VFHLAEIDDSATSKIMKSFESITLRVDELNDFLTKLSAETFRQIATMID
jgi:hypothetical protein